MIYYQICSKFTNLNRILEDSEKVTLFTIIDIEKSDFLFSYLIKSALIKE